MSFGGILKQSTAVDVLIGPFVDSTDGDTEETALTINQADVRLSKNGQTAAQKNDVTAAAHDADGMYNCELDATDTDTVGQLTVYVHVAGALMVRHDFQVIEEVVYDALYGSAATGALPVSDKTGFRLSSTGVDDIWDEGTSGHVAAGSFGAALAIARSGTAQAGAASTITLDASANANNDFYNNGWIFIVSGTGAGQGNTVSDYDGTTKVATVQDTWAVNPDNTSVFVVMPRGGVPGASAPTAADNAAAVWDRAYNLHTSEGSFGSLFQAFHEGTAQAGTVSSLTLDATGASATDDFYNFSVAVLVSGTGAGQSRQITDYNGTTNVATVDPAWTITPDNTTQYVIVSLGIDAITGPEIADLVWDEPRAEHVTADTFGQFVFADTIRVSGSTSAADGLEAAVSGATPLPANVHEWLSVDVVSPTQPGRPVVDVTHVSGAAQDIATATALTAVDNVVDAIELDTQNIQSRLPAALNNGVMPADIQRINDVALVGDGSGTPFTV